MSGLPRACTSAYAANYPNEPLFAAMGQTAENFAIAGNNVLAVNQITDEGRGPPGAYASYEVNGLWTTYFPYQDRPITSALRGVAWIEEKHILALTTALGRASSPEMQVFYSSELAAARNNFRNAAGLLSDYGSPYTPQFLPQDVYTNIIGGQNELVPAIPVITYQVPSSS